MREKGFIRKENIKDFDLIRKLCEQDVFSETAFWYMAEAMADWDPSDFLKPSDEYIRLLPIYRVTYYSKNISGFRTVFELRMGHFPSKMGLSFHDDGCGNSSDILSDGLQEVQKRRS